MTRDCISDIELEALIKELKKHNIKYNIYRNNTKGIFIRGCPVKYTVEYNSQIEFK